jgi:hypothetical protein
LSIIVSISAVQNIKDDEQAPWRMLHTIHQNIEQSLKTITHQHLHWHSP